MHHDVVVHGVTQLAVRGDPGVQDAGGLQRSLDASLIRFRNAIDEVDHLPQRSSRAPVPTGGVPGVGHGWRVVATGRQPVDFLGEVGPCRLRGRASPVGLGSRSAKFLGCPPDHVGHGRRGRIHSVRRVGPARQRAQHLVRVGDVDVLGIGEVAPVRVDERGAALGDYLVGGRDPVGGGLLLAGGSINLLACRPQLRLRCRGVVQQPLHLAQRGVLPVDQLLASPCGGAVRRLVNVQCRQYVGMS